MTTGLCNLRDVGGLPLVGGGTVRAGVLFRGDAPMAGDEDPGLQPWPPGSVIDLRSDDERAILDTSLYWPPSIPVLEVAGVETEAMISDQLRSNEAIDDLRARFERALGKTFVAPVPHTLGDALLAALQVWRAHPGGAAGWLVEHGLAPREVDALRTRLRG